MKYLRPIKTNESPNRAKTQEHIRVQYYNKEFEFQGKHP